ncbi:hypothetical protein [Dechloromonas sp. A34]|uniref:hypothetical protein n=1 Tax=Dechloromonas sp. A34 TaxID=447588 RepID=UPI0022487E48|nr:hypothetical protein [Dechloromonas sp. A34]
MSLFLISALRALVEMLALCLLAQGFLYLMAGQKRAGNVIYRFFALLTDPPRRLVARLLPAKTSALTVGVISFVLLFLLWIGLALARKFV